MSTELLRKTIYESLLELSTESGINASGKDDVYGCIFGRDSAITILKILKALKNKNATEGIDRERLLGICRRALLTLISLQGKETNMESGEQPGKFIHEYRPDNYERLLKMEKPWYIYPDGVLRNYDSIDSTPLALIALYRYWKASNDDAFLLEVLPSVEAGLNWIISYGDSDKDYLLEYTLPEDRQHGGLLVQSWTDSHESLRGADGKFPQYPIAPVEVQGYAWLALKLWADFYHDRTINGSNTDRFASILESQAMELKKQFNKLFIFEENGQYFAAQALDGVKNKITTFTGNPLLLLWATYNSNPRECILNDEYIPHIVGRAFQDDMFDHDAGIRTMSTKADTFDGSQSSYHNGSFWPKLNGMSHEGLTNWAFETEADKLKDATIKPIAYFGTAIELYIKLTDGTYAPFIGPDGQEACRQQAWTAATALDLLTL